MGNLTKGVKAMFTESEFVTLTECADASGKCPSEWLRDVALKNMAPSWMGMSREVVEVRVAVNTIAELLFKAFPDRLPAEFIKRVVKEGRDNVVDQKAAAAGGNGSAVGQGKL
jgi:hypothetical protein